MRVYRLLEIITLLLKNGTVPAKEFAARFNVSTRTIYRDVEDLSSAGIPVYMTQGKGGGISLLDHYTFNKTLVTQNEIDSMLMAVKTLQATQYPEIDRFLDKLEALFKSSASKDWVKIEFSPWGSKPNEDEKFIKIKQAILEQKVIHFYYVNALGEGSQRQVEPMQVIFKSNSWYLWGYCQTRQDFRTFRLTRIKDLDISNHTFERRRVDPSLDEEKHRRTDSFLPVKLNFSKEVIHRVYDDFDNALIQKKPDDSCEVTVILAEDEWVYGFILSYGCYVEVVEPEHIRRIILSRLKQAITQYE